MEILKKLLITILIVTIIVPFMPVPSSYAADDDQKIWSNSEQYEYVEKYIRAYLQEANNFYDVLVYDKGNSSKWVISYKQNELPISELGTSNGIRKLEGGKTGPAYEDSLVFVCSVFTAAMLHQSLGVELSGYSWASYSTSDKSNFIILDDNDELQPGDVIRKTDAGHSIIYVGVDPATGEHQLAETGAWGWKVQGKSAFGYTNLGNLAKNERLTVAKLKTATVGTKTFKNIYVSRLRRDVVDAAWQGVPDQIVIQWPRGTTSYVDPNDISSVHYGGGSGGSSGSTEEGDNTGKKGNFDMSAALNGDVLIYEGIPESIGSGGVRNNLNEVINKVVDFFKDIINYIIGLPTLIVKIPLIGLARAVEVTVTAAARIVSTENGNSVITIEDIIFNKVPLFDINIFDFSEAGGIKIDSQNSQGSEVILAVRENIANWYFAFRNFTIVVLLAILIYLGIRMAITSIAEEKAHYKRMLVDWFVSFFIVLFIHYFLAIVLSLNEFLVNLFAKQITELTDTGSIYESMRVLAYSMKFTEGWYGTIVYIAFVWLMVKYTWKYAKRMLSGYILIILSPLVSISYALDKIKDNRSQSLSKWMKEVLYTVLIQSAHALIYTVFASAIIVNIANSGDDIWVSAGQIVFLIISVKFMDVAEGMFRNIFGFESSSILKETMDSSFEMFAKFKMIRQYVRGVRTTGRNVLKFGGITARFAGRHIPRVQSKIDVVDEFTKSYRAARDGEEVEIEGGGGMLGTETSRMLGTQRSERIKIRQEQDANAKAALGASKGFVKGVGTALYNFPTNPMVFVASTAASIGQFKIVLKKANKGRKDFRKNPIAESKKEKLILNLDGKSTLLSKKITELYENKESLLAKANDPNATNKEKFEARVANSVIIKLFSERSKIISKESVKDAMEEMVLKTTKKRKFKPRDGRFI